MIVPKNERLAKQLGIPPFAMIEAQIIENTRKVQKDKAHVANSKANSGKLGGLIDLFWNLNKESFQTMKYNIDRSHSINIVKPNPGVNTAVNEKLAQLAQQPDQARDRKSQKLKMQKVERNQKILNCFQDVSEDDDEKSCKSRFSSSDCLSTPDKKKRGKSKGLAILQNIKKPALLVI